MNPAEIVAQRRATLASLHPVKVEARQRAQELMEKRHDLKAQCRERAEVRDIMDNHALDLFPTPPGLARRMVELAEPLTGYSILEPSAGTGNIAREIKKAGHECECIELNYTAAEYLKKQGYFVTCADFLEWTPAPACVTYDRIIMNPPFSHAADIDHVTHAWNLLTPGGRIIAIMSAGTQYRQDKKSAAFRESILSHATLIETLPAGTFKQSGTNVTSILIVLEKG